MNLSILESGEREMFKAGVHAMALALAVVMDLYNLSAWLYRRQRHLAFNTIVYTALAFYEYGHVRHHRASALEAALLAGLAVPVESTDTKAA